MIIKQYRDVINGTKTQTRRLNADFYKVGSIHSIVPARTKPTIYYCWTGDGLEIAHELYNNFNYNEQGLDGNAWQPLKVRIVDKWQEPLQSITEADALAEGIHEFGLVDTHKMYDHELSPHELFVTAIDAYHNLWDCVNHAKKYQWAANPMIWVVKFERVVRHE